MKRITPKQRKLYLAIAILVVTLAGVGVFAKLSRPPASSPTRTPTPSPTFNQADFNPKTDSEQARRQQTSPSPTPTPSATASPTPGTTPTPVAKGPIKPTILGADQDTTTISVDALVDGQTSGTCTATLSRTGSTSVSVSGPLTQVTSYYACKTMVFNKSGLAKGIWNVTVVFENAEVRGVSDSQTVTVN